MASYNDFKGEDNAGQDSPAMVIGRKTVIGAVLVLFTVVCFFLVLHIYARCFSGHRDRGSFRRRQQTNVGEQNRARLQRLGLGKSAIEAIPVFVYQAENHKDGLECAVCLCEFEGNEKGRLLPNCHHSFHIDCIDMWLQSHKTCPLCRASAQPNIPSDSVVVLVGDKEVVSGSGPETDHQETLPTVSEGIASTSMEPGLDTDQCPSCRHDEVLPESPTYATNMLFWAIQKRASSVSNSVFFDQGTTSTSRKTLDKIIIDIPQRVDSFCSPRLYSSDDQQVFSPSGQSLKSPGIRLRSPRLYSSDDQKVFSPSGQSLKSPGIRLRSLKRLLSKGKKVVPQSPHDGTRIDIVQGDSSQSSA